MPTEPKLFNPADAQDAIDGIRSLVEAMFMMASDLTNSEQTSAFQRVARMALGDLESLHGYIDECRQQEAA